MHCRLFNAAILALSRAVLPVRKFASLAFARREGLNTGLEGSEASSCSKDSCSEVRIGDDEEEGEEEESDDADRRAAATIA